MTDRHEKLMKRFNSAGLYVVSSEAMSRGRSSLEIIRAAIAGGARLIQIREKNLCAARLLEVALKARRLTREADALLIINDRIDIALASGADGVHLGQNDLPLTEARKLAPDMIIGSSTHSVEEALAAQSEGASYINIGPIFPTHTKKWTDAFLGLKKFSEIARSVSLPCTVMGGIKKQHIEGLIKAGARTIALVSAVTGADDPERAASELLAEIAEFLPEPNISF